MKWLDDSMSRAWRVLFGPPIGEDLLALPARSIEGVDEDDLEQFSRFMRALREVLPTDAVLRIKPASRLDVEYRKLEGREEVFGGGLLGRSRSVFWLKPTAENIERICELRKLEPPFQFVMNIEVIARDTSLMNWCVMSDHRPEFSAAMDVEKLQTLAAACGGRVSNPIERWVGFCSTA